MSAYELLNLLNELRNKFNKFIKYMSTDIRFYLEHDI